MLRGRDMRRRTTTNIGRVAPDTTVCQAAAKYILRTDKEQRVLLGGNSSKR
jgi:hypothetical protein